MIHSAAMDGRSSQRIEIDGSALAHNLGIFRDVVGPGVAVMAVVKANAYGHGLEQVVPVADEVADWFGVHSLSEARALRALGVSRPILVMGYAPCTDLSGLDEDIHVLVSTEEVLEGLMEYRERTGVRVPVHLKIDTGTHRQGVPPEKLPELCRAAARRGLSIVGAATHFANIEDTINHEFAELQLERFDHGLAVLEGELGERPQFVHSACSAAGLLFRKADYSLVRVGISMYGHWPSPETRLSWILDHGRDGIQLRPALTWKAVIGQLNDIEPGATVSYGRTWRALRPTRLAVLPVGYSDGYPRVLGNRSRVLVGGVPAPVVGRVCMNIILVDVTDVPGVRVGDEAVLIGRQNGAEVTAEELAELSGTINYEILARLSPRIPRVLRENRDGEL